MRNVVWGLVILLIIIHQDFWFWTNNTLVFGFIPIGLFFHACISLAAAATWYLATLYCWPEDLSHDAPAADTSDNGGDA